MKSCGRSPHEWGWYFCKSHKTAWLLSLLSAHVRTWGGVSSLQPTKGAPHISAWSQTSRLRTSREFLWHCTAAQTMRQFVRKQLKGEKNPSPCFLPNTSPSTTQLQPASPALPFSHLHFITLCFRPPKNTQDCLLPPSLCKSCSLCLEGASPYHPQGDAFKAFKTWAS